MRNCDLKVTNPKTMLATFDGNTILLTNMKVSQSLRRPANWQDFESLCKKLWGEIWSCPEIQKNGRSGQDQSGVDIFGTPKDDPNSYYGIQCKGKSEYDENKHPQFTEKEICEEIEKAKKFTPPLKKLYFATTAVNDSKIQSFVREKNIEHKSQNLFEIHLFCWETIVDLIDENKHTHDWYVKSLNYKANYSVAISFENGSTEISLEPKFIKLITGHVSNKRSEHNDLVKGYSVLGRVLMPTTGLLGGGTQINLSLCPISFKIINTGTEPIEEYKLLFSLSEEIQDSNDTNEETDFPLINPKYRYIPDIHFDPQANSGKVVPKNNILVGDDIFVSDDLYIKPLPKEYTLLVDWKLVSKTFKTDGQLKINILPTFETNYKTVISSEKSGIEESIQDCLVPKKKK